jgi:hypothetical protein
MAQLKEMVTIVKEQKKTPEEKQYLVCIRGKDGGTDEWDVLECRTDAYEYIKSNIEYIDLEKSFILVENLPLAKRKSIFAFMKYVQDNYEDGFDIEDYVKGDWDENDFKNMNGISPEFMAASQSEKLDIRDQIDGNFEVTDIS